MRGIAGIVDRSGMDARIGPPPHKPAPVGLAITQLALTVAIALGGMWAVVNLAGSQDELVEPLMRPLTAGAQSEPEGPEFRLIDPMPRTSVVFIVGSAQAGLDLTKVLQLDAVVRAVTHERLLDASVTVVESEEQAAAMRLAARDATSHRGVVTAVEVIDLR